MAAKNDPKKPSQKKRKKSAFSEARDNTASPPSKPSASTQPQGPRWFLIGLFVTIVFGGGALAMVFKDARSWNAAMSDVEQFTYEVVEEYPHDPDAFTQGLFFHDGKLYESTGKYGKSTMRIVDLKTGKPVSDDKNVALRDDLFGEGAVYHDGKIYQLTWKEGECLVYDLDLNLLETIKYEGEGWGLCSDGTHLIMTNSSSKLIYVDPKDFSEIKSVRVRAGNRPISRLNEMEYIGGSIYANQLDRDYIYEIDAKTGKVTGMINLSGLWPASQRPTGGVLNGIAKDPNYARTHVLVTGKYCPKFFKIEIVPAK